MIRTAANSSEVLPEERRRVLRSLTNDFEAAEVISSRALVPLDRTQIVLQLLSYKGLLETRIERTTGLRFIATYRLPPFHQLLLFWLRQELQNLWPWKGAAQSGGLY